MKVHVIVASRHGSTTEIAEAIAEALRAHDLCVSVIELTPDPPADLRLGPRDAVVLGSAIYAGSWIKAARRFLKLYGDQLNPHRTWLFSSGPLGSDADPSTEVAGLDLDTPAVDHHVFCGMLDRERLGVGEWLVAAAVRAPEGDFRDWEEITEWSGRIAEQLLSSV